MPRYCINEDCEIRACFSMRGSKLGEYCKKHKLAGYINVNDKTCLLCDKRPNFGDRDDKIPVYCKEHKLPNYINVVNKTCLLCDKIPNFGDREDKIALYCSEHKLDDHINVKSKRCLLCNKLSTFGLKGTKLELYCFDHKLDGYVNVKNKKCLLCNKQPNFGVKGTNKALYCVEHKSQDHINVKNKTCLSCNKQPKFGVKGTKKALYCSQHKLDDYVNVKDKTCLSCNKRPNFGVKNTKIALYCKDHKKLEHVDVKHKICICNNCNIRATFGPLFQPKQHCAKHKNNNEFRKNKPKCSGDKCKQLPIWTEPESIYPQRCDDHKLDDDINIVEKECVSCKLSWIIPENQTMCLACREFNIPSIRNRKELKIKDMLEANNIEYEMHDKIVNIECSRKRPDFVLDYGFYKVIIEVDENQHCTYPCECEQSRMIQIHQDIGMNLLFIRFNPDSYKDNENKRVKSYTGRETRLLELLNSLKNTEKRSHYLEVIHMYYDGWDGQITIENVNY